MTKISEMTEKISPVANDVLAGLDSEDTNNATKNKTFKLSSLWNAIFGNRTSDNIPEGNTSLYATEENLGNSTIIQALQNDKADKDNVLELDNTTEYIPTEDYHPATKEYVDTRSLPDASETVKGVVEKATEQEVIDGTADKYLDANLYGAGFYTGISGTTNEGDNILSVDLGRNANTVFMSVVIRAQEYSSFYGNTIGEWIKISGYFHLKKIEDLNINKLTAAIGNSTSNGGTNDLPTGLSLNSIGGALTTSVTQNNRITLVSVWMDGTVLKIKYNFNGAYVGRTALFGPITIIN